jgi:hypothetical protein
MEEPGHGIVGRESELARVRSFIGSVSEGPSALLLEGAAGIGKSTLWHADRGASRFAGLGGGAGACQSGPIGCPDVLSGCDVGQRYRLERSEAGLGP